MFSLNANGLLILALVSTHMAEAYGQHSRTTKSTYRYRHYEYYQGPKRDQYIPRDFYLSSASERQTKTISVIGGLHGAAVGVYLHPDILFNVKYELGGSALGILDVNKDILQEAKDELGASAFGLWNVPDYNRYVSGNLDWYIGNSFYLSTGFGQRKLRYVGLDLAETRLAANSPFKREITYTNYAVEISIGNRWQWELLSLGAKWIGVIIPVDEPEYEFNFQGGDLGLAYAREKEFRSKNAGVTGTGLFFYVGLAI